MRIAIYGCGAMGTVIGAFLTQNGCMVDMIDSYEEHVNAMKRKGAEITGTVNLHVKVNAILPVEMTGVYDVIFLMTKQTANSVVLNFLLNFMHEESTVCTLQNGVPEPAVAEIIGTDRTVGGTILWGATFIKPGESEVTQDLSRNDHLFEIGEMDGVITPRIAKIAGILNAMGPVQVTDHLMDSRWGKLINNACMSGMSAVTGGKFGEVLDNSVARQCLSYIGREVKRCCEAESYRLPILLHEQKPDSFELQDKEMFEENQEMFLSMYSDMREAKASMLQDLEKGKLSEVNQINGFVSSIGKKHGIKTPFNDRVVEIITKIENSELQLSMENLRLFDTEWFEY